MLFASISFALLPSALLPEKSQKKILRAGSEAGEGSLKNEGLKAAETELTLALEPLALEQRSTSQQSALEFAEIDSQLAGNCIQSPIVERFDCLGRKTQLDEALSLLPPNALFLKIDFLQFLGATVGVRNGIGIIRLFASKLTATRHRICSGYSLKWTQSIMIQQSLRRGESKPPT